MTAKTITSGGFGPGTFVDVEYTPFPAECRRLLHHFAEVSSGFTADASVLDQVNFYRDHLPIIPSQAMSAVCHAMIGIVGKEICALRGIDTGNISIDVDKAGLYPSTPVLVSINRRTWPRFRTTIISNLNPPAFLKAYNLDSDALTATRDEAYNLIKAEIVKYSATKLDQKNMEHGFYGQTCYTPAQWRETSIGQRLAAHPLINYRRVALGADLPPVPFQSTKHDQRPLAGIKVIKLARVIASPAMGAALASLGAEVIKVQSPNLPDLQPLSVQLTAGKQTFALDLTIEADKKKLHALIEGADVIIQAFRLRSLERRGFGLEDVLETARARGKGIVYIDLNCYGPDGYYAERPGFQQIADAASGCSYVCGKAYGFDEGVGVLPSLPIADMLSGAVGVIDTMLALRDRAEYGGSYHAAVSLTAVNAVQLEEAVGLYSPEIVKRIQDKYQFAPMTPDLHVEELLAVIGNAWKNNFDLLGRDGYMVQFSETAWGKDHAILSPIVAYGNSSATPRWLHGPVPYCASTSAEWA